MKETPSGRGPGSSRQARRNRKRTERRKRAAAKLRAALEVADKLLKRCGRPEGRRRKETSPARSTTASETTASETSSSSCGTARTRSRSRSPALRDRAASPARPAPAAGSPPGATAWEQEGNGAAHPLRPRRRRTPRPSEEDLRLILKRRQRSESSYLRSTNWRSPSRDTEEEEDLGEWGSGPNLEGFPSWGDLLPGCSLSQNTRESPESYRDRSPVRRSATGAAEARRDRAEGDRPAPSATRAPKGGTKERDRSASTARRTTSGRSSGTAPRPRTGRPRREREGQGPRRADLEPRRVDPEPRRGPGPRQGDCKPTQDQAKEEARRRRREERDPRLQKRRARLSELGAGYIPRSPEPLPLEDQVPAESDPLGKGD